MSLRVLVVDDNPTNLKLVCDLLEMEQYLVQRAVDAVQAEKLIRTGSFDVILMDVELPGTDGLTLTRKLKADTTTKDIPVIALTAYAMKGDDIKVKEAGCDGYITKPIDTRKFTAQISEILQLRNPLSTKRERS